MNRLLVLLMFLAMCNGCAAIQGDADTSTPAPPDSTAYTTGTQVSVDAFINSFDSSVRDALSNQGFAVEQQQNYRVTHSALQIIAFYDNALVPKNWRIIDSGVSQSPEQLMHSYQKNNVLFLVAAIDGARYGENSTIVYTVKATK